MAAPKLNDRERCVFVIARAIRRYYARPLTDGEDVRTAVAAALLMAQHEKTAEMLREAR